MAGLGRKVFNSGDILLASEVQGYLQDQAVMVFDDAAARGSAIPSPTEGMLTYNKDTDALELYDGSAFGPVGSDAGLIHIETVQPTGVSAISFSNNAFNSSYSHFYINWVLKFTSNGSLLVRLRASGSDDNGNNYKRQGFTITGSTLSGFDDAVSNAWANTASDSTDAVGQLWLNNPNVAVPTGARVFNSHYSSTYNGLNQRQSGLGHTQSTAYDSISFIAATGGNFVTGSKISLYGFEE